MKRQPRKIRKINCPYCNVLLDYRGAKRIQLGRYSLFGHWDNLNAGSLNVQVYECPSCGKIEMFRAR